MDQAALLSPMMVTTSPTVGAGILIAAGLYQWTPSKNACLEHCRAPASFISKHWRAGSAGALRMGMHHGLYCLGCCWALMLLLFLRRRHEPTLDRRDHAVRAAGRKSCRPAHKAAAGRAERWLPPVWLCCS